MPAIISASTVGVCSERSSSTPGNVYWASQSLSCPFRTLTAPPHSRVLSQAAPCHPRVAVLRWRPRISARLPSSLSSPRRWRTTSASTRNSKFRRSPDPPPVPDPPLVLGPPLAAATTEPSPQPLTHSVLATSCFSPVFLSAVRILTMHAHGKDGVQSVWGRPPASVT